MNDKIKNILFKVENLYKNIKVNVRGFFIGLKNLIKWFPLIWEDRDWDYYFLLLLIEKKLKFIKKDIENSGFVDKPNVVKKLNICLFLLKRIKEDNYFEDNLKYFKSEHECLKWSFKKYKDDVKILFNIMEKEIFKWWT